MNKNSLVDYDMAIRNDGYNLVCGVDEAGRGPLFGPVSAAAVIMPMDSIIDGINDSKKLSEKKREILYEYIKKAAIAYSCVFVDNRVIDKINILEASKLAMKTAINNLKIKPDIILIDALKLNTGIKECSIIHGDATSYNIAAASIIAKVERDRYIRECAINYPEYLLVSNKGYGTAVHIEALKEHGATRLHRKSFISKFTDTNYDYEDLK